MSLSAVPLYLLCRYRQRFISLVYVSLIYVIEELYAAKIKSFENSAVFSLYMKEMGVTGQQFGGIIAVGFISGAVFSLFGGVITDHFGRKKTTLLFDLLAWPFAIFIYFISRSYALFLLATAANNTLRITTVAWNLMVVEDADSDQRKAAYNILNIISIAMGLILAPTAACTLLLI